MNDQSLQKALHELASQRVSKPVDLWPRLSKRLENETPSRQMSKFLVRWGWIGIVVMIFGLLAFAVSNPKVQAAVPFITRVFQSDDRLSTIDVSRGVELDLKQKWEGVDLSVKWVYADEKYVLIGYLLHSPQEERYEPYREQLKGTSCYTWEGTYGFVGESDFLNLRSSSNETAYLAIFKNTCRRVPTSLHFSVYAKRSLVSLIPSENSTPPSNNGLQILNPISAPPPIGPFEFELTLPSP